MVTWSIGLSAVAILISGLSVHWSRKAAAINREIERLRAERRRDPYPGPEPTLPDPADRSRFVMPVPSAEPQPDPSAWVKRY